MARKRSIIRAVAESVEPVFWIVREVVSNAIDRRVDARRAVTKAREVINGGGAVELPLPDGGRVLLLKHDPRTPRWIM